MKHLSSLLHRLFLFFLLLVVSACSGSDTSEFDVDSPDELSPEQQSLNHNRQRWSQSNVSSYQFVDKRFCYCLPEQDIVVTILNGQVDNAFFTPSGSYLTENRIDQLLTVDDYFDLIQEAIDSQVASLEVTYDAMLGYPLSIYIDRDERLADEEVRYTLSELQ